MNEWETCIDEWAERLRVSRQETADAQATIADLQGQLEAAKKKVAGYDRWLSGGVYYTNAEFEEQINDRVNVRNERAALKQRVAQLEGELVTAKAPRVYDCGSCAIGKGFEQRVAQLEADNRTYINERHENMKTIETLQADHARVLGLVQDVVNAGVSMEDPRIAYKEVQIDREWFDRAAASLPAQRAKLAQGGAVSKPVTTCNRHSDCDAADEKARAKGALNADHCHDDCCSECFGN